MTLLPWLDRLVRPRSLLVVVLFAGAVGLWPLAGLTPADAFDAVAADVAFADALAAGDWTAAAAAGRRRLAVAAIPPDVGHAFAIADALVRAGAVAEGLAAGESALSRARATAGETSPEAAIAENNLAWMLASLDQPTPADLDRAWELAGRAVAHDGENAFFLGTLGTVALGRGDLAAAEEHLRRAVERHDPPALAATDRVLLAIVLARRGDRAAARAALEAARQDGPDPVWLRRAEEALAAP